MGDKVNHPDHYNQGAIECIVAIEAALGVDGVIAFCQGNVMKYLWRAGHKDGEKTLHDFRKAQWYINHAIKVMERVDAGQTVAG